MSHYAYANLGRVILNDECMGGQTCLRMSFCTATDIDPICFLFNLKYI